MKNLLSFFYYPWRKNKEIPKEKNNEPSPGKMIFKGDCYEFKSSLSKHTLLSTDATFEVSILEESSHTNEYIIDITLDNSNKISFSSELISNLYLFSNISTKNKCLFWENQKKYFLYEFSLDYTQSELNSLFTLISPFQSSTEYDIDSLLPVEITDTSNLEDNTNSTNFSLIFCSEGGDLYELDEPSDTLLKIASPASLEIFEGNEGIFLSVYSVMTKITFQAKFQFNDNDLILMWISNHEDPKVYIAYCYFFSNLNCYFTSKKIISRILDDESDNNIINIASSQGKLHDRTFVLKNEGIVSVLKTSKYNELLPFMALPLKSPSNYSCIETFNNDTNLLFLDPESLRTPIIQHDIILNKTISEWETPSELSSPIVSICQEDKTSNSSPIIMGVNKDDIIYFDSRLNSKSKVCNINNYKNKNFTSIASCKGSLFAIANKAGEVRLYNKYTTQAKSLFPCYGDEITYIDLTKDGLYAIATCNKYLIVIPTQDGFIYNIKKKEMIYITLTISESDIRKYSLDNYVFNKAKFDNNKNEEENKIVCGLGKYIVVWDFEKIKKGIFDSYTIILTGENNVKDNMFKYINDDIIAMTDDNLSLQVCYDK